MVNGITDDNLVGLTKPPSSPGWIVNVESIEVFHIRILSFEALKGQTISSQYHCKVGLTIVSVLTKQYVSHWVSLLHMIQGLNSQAYEMT